MKYSIYQKDRLYMEVCGGRGDKIYSSASVTLQRESSSFSSALCLSWQKEWRRNVFLHWLQLCNIIIWGCALRGSLIRRRRVWSCTLTPANLPKQPERLAPAPLSFPSVTLAGSRLSVVLFFIFLNFKHSPHFKDLCWREKHKKRKPDHSSHVPFFAAALPFSPLMHQ